MFQTRSRLFRLLMLPALLPLFPALGCGTTNTERGLSGGAGVGAVLGALAGGPRHALGGALIGAGAGAAVGGIAGAAADNSERKTAARVAAARAMQLQDIVRLTQDGRSDEIIIGQIQSSGTVFALRTDDVLYLSNNGVREPVIRYMQATATRMVPVYGAVQPVYVVEPPPVGIGVGVRIR
jgi:hypothetical protein